MAQASEYLQNFAGIQDFLLSSATLDMLVWGVFYILLVIFLLYSAVLLYHWLRYGSLYAITWVMMIVYFSVSFVLISTMFGTAIALT